jgi:hypothetical protein
MSLSNPIEAMARAFLHQHLVEISWKSEDPDYTIYDEVGNGWEEYEGPIRAALQSLLDHPLPEEVEEAGWKAIQNHPDDGKGSVHHVFHAMIRKLLEDQDSSVGRDERTATPPTSTPGQAGKEGG